MKILLVTPNYEPVLGGVETVVKEEAEGLAKMGHTVVVATSYDPVLELPKKEMINEVNVIRHMRYSLADYDPLHIRELIALSNVRKYDIIHLHANKRAVTDTYAIYSQLTGSRYVFTPHAGQFGTTKLGQFHNATIGKIALNARRVFYVTRFEKNLISPYINEQERLVELKNGVNVKRYKTPHKRKEILFVGRLVKHKGVDVLIRAFAKIKDRYPDYQLSIVGPDGGEWPKLNKLIQELNIEDRVTYYGPVSDEQRDMHLREAEIFCSPSRSEAFGITLIEGVASDCKVVGSNIGAIEEVLGYGIYGWLFKKDDVEDLAEVLITAINADVPDRRAVDKYIESLSWSNHIEKLNNYYWDVLLEDQI